MKHLNLILIVFLLCAGVASCRKKDNNRPETVPRVTQLKEGAYSTNPAIPTGYINFSYDNAGRVTKIFSYVGNEDYRVSVLDTINILDFYYSGSFNLPTSVAVTGHGGTSYTTDYHRLGYDNTGKLIKDTFYISSSSSGGSLSINNTMELSYTANYILRKGISNNYISTDTVFISEGNITSFKTYASKVIYEYDDKVNPFYSLNVSPVFLAIARGEPNLAYFLDWSPFNKNNLTKSTDYYNGSPVPNTITNHSFILNSFGLPLRSFSIDRFGYTRDTLEYKY